MEPSLSLVIRTYGMERLPEIFASLQSQDGGTRFGPNSINEIVLVNGDRDGALRAESFPLSYNVVQTTLDPAPYRPGKALNTGVRLATGDIVVFLSGHSLPLRSNWLRSLVSPFADPGIAGVCGAQRPRQESNWLEALYRSVWYNSAHLAGMFGHFNLANAAIRKRYWELCPFNESLVGCEDRLWSRTISARYGGRFVFCKEALVCHSHVCSVAESIRYFLWLWKATLASR